MQNKIQLKIFLTLYISCVKGMMEDPKWLYDLWKKRKRREGEREGGRNGRTEKGRKKERKRKEKSTHELKIV